MTPLVSIIIPTYNRSHLLGETLDSVIVQTHTPWECIVVDDGSEDYTKELMEFYCGKDSRIQYYHRPKDRPKGANACRNYGFEKSNGEYIQWLDSDDLLDHEKINKQVYTLQNNESIDLVFCDYRTFNNHKENNSHPNKQIDFTLCNSPVDLFNLFGKYNSFLPPSCYLMKRRNNYLSGGWNEYLKINQDGEYFVRVLFNCNKIKFTSKATLFYRQNPSENRVSNYNSIEKAEHAVLSWKLIDAYFRLYDFSKNHTYLQYGKNNIFYSLTVKGFPNVINENALFFRKQIRSKKPPRIQVLKRLRNKYLSVKSIIWSH